MTWKYRRAGGWQAPTIKTRENGRWVEIGDRSDDSRGTNPSDIPERFYTDGPPERSGSTITYPDDGHASIEDAILDLNSGDELYIQTDTYDETISVGSELADNITIRGDLELAFDSDGRATVAQEGPTIQATSTVLDIDQIFFGSDTTVTSPVSVGDTVIEVNDASTMSIGDIALISEDDTRPFGEPAAGGATGADTTAEFREVVDIDTSNNTLTFRHGVHLPYPLETSCRIDDVDFNVDDFRVSGIRFSCQNAGDEPVEIRGVKNGWFDNILSQDAGDDDHHFRVRRSFRCRFDGYHGEGDGQYSLNLTDHTTDTLVTNASSRDHTRYTVRLGPTSDPASGLWADGIYGENLSGRSVLDVHHGGFKANFFNAIGEDAQWSAFRSRGITADGGENRECDDRDFVWAQRSHDVIIRNVSIVNKIGSSPVFRWRMRSADARDRPGDEVHSNITLENIDIEDYGVGITDIGEFQIDDTGGLEPSGPFTFRNIIYNGRQLTESDVQQWDGYDSKYITGLTVE